MKKIITILTILLSTSVYSVGTDGSNSKGTQICFKVGTDGSNDKVGTDGSNDKVGTDGSNDKTICQIINIEEKESFYSFDSNFRRY